MKSQLDTISSAKIAQHLKTPDIQFLLINSVFILLILTACTALRKEEEIETPRTLGYVALPTEEMAKRSKTSLKELHIGFGVYLRKCGECHSHKLPDEVSDKDWHIITPKMAWNANITDEEQNALLKYILATKTIPSHSHIHFEPMEFQNTKK